MLLTYLERGEGGGGTEEGEEERGERGEEKSRWKGRLQYQTTTLLLPLGVN